MCYIGMYHRTQGRGPCWCIPSDDQEVGLFLILYHSTLLKDCCRLVEETYHLDIGAAQVTQLSRAINTGAEKGVFVLPKGTSAPAPLKLLTHCILMLCYVISGPSGKVKLPPKTTKSADTSAKEVGLTKCLF